MESLGVVPYCLYGLMRPVRVVCVLGVVEVSCVRLLAWPCRVRRAVSRIHARILPPSVDDDRCGERGLELLPRVRRARRACHTVPQLCVDGGRASLIMDLFSIMIQCYNVNDI